MSLGAYGRLWRRDPLSAFALTVLILLIVLGALGPHLPFGEATRIAAAPRLSPPSWRFPFGADELGRSFLPRVVVGIRATFLLSAAAVAMTALLGTALGMIAGYLRGAIDPIVVRAADVLFSFPALLIGLLIAAAVGPGETSAIAVIAVATLPLFVRVVRSVTLALSGRGFIVAAEVAGASPLRIMAVHILPNIAGAVVVQLTYALSIGMIIESALSFLGLGVQPPDASLGSLLRQGSAYLTFAPWLALTSGAVLALAIMSVNLVGDAVRDALEPLERALAHMSALIEARGLTMAYESGSRRTIALDGAELTVARDESLALVGESGSGKTTLGMAIGRLLPRAARREAGDLLVDGRSVFELADAELRALRRENLGFVFQNPMTALDPTMRVGRQVALALGRRDGVRDMLARVELDDPERVMRSFPHQLSGGMAQRVVIAMAIARQPLVVIADEPTASLDASVRDRVMATLERLRAETQASLVILSHDLRMVARHAQRVAVMYGGRPVEIGLVAQVLTRPAHPYTRALMSAGAGGETPGARLHPIAGAPPVLSAPASACAFAPRCPMRQALCDDTRPEPRDVAGRLVACHFAEANA